MTWQKLGQPEIMIGRHQEDVPFAGDLSSLELDTEYRSQKDDPVGQFYVKCLRNANTYDRAVGYFRSTVFLVIGPSIIDFVKKGGKLRVICSPDLALDDVRHIAEGYLRRAEVLQECLCAEFDALLANRQTVLGALTLATLIAFKALEIKIAERANGHGMYHEKLGIFSDSLGNAVSFKGSANETWSGWHNQGNFESIEVFCSWRGGLERRRIDRHKTHFSSLWSEEDPDIVVVPFPPTVEEYITRFAVKRLDDLLTEPPDQPLARRSPLPHQLSAIKAWEASGRRGVLMHATGSGKTFTAIIAIKDHCSRGLPAIVLVPSRLLLAQWAAEIAAEIPEAALLLAGGGNDRWRAANRLKSMTASDDRLGPRIVLAMMQTAALQEFRSLIRSGSHLLVVADEVHQTGSHRNSDFFDVDAGSRLGLSATPERFGDPSGTARLFGYFGPVVPPPITLMDAVASGRLVPYEYHPHPINLTASEADDWLKQTRQIQQEMAKHKNGPDGRAPLSDRAKMLLIKRSRVAKKALSKVRLSVEVVQSSFQEGQSWLIYCEDGGQLTDVIIALRAEGYSPVEYHSSMMGDRDETMAWFRTFGGILVSIKCLDEGVDIPAVSHALILASSQNPRQFIQRRGRVLRHAPMKHLAVIHDAIVVPIDAEKEPEQVSLLKAELARSLEFANNALNRGAGAQLRAIAATMGLDVDEMIGSQGEEEDDA